MTRVTISWSQTSYEIEDQQTERVLIENHDCTASDVLSHACKLARDNGWKVCDTAFIRGYSI